MAHTSANFAPTLAWVDRLFGTHYLPPGSYRIGLRLPDAEVSLADDPRQAIRLVNGAWDPADGVNWFDAMVEVQ